MKKSFPNQYEKALAAYLTDNHIQYIPIDERKRAAFSAAKMKSFDFLIHSPRKHFFLTEVKGRKFDGTSLANLSGLQCWVTTDDIDGLAAWQGILGPPHTAMIVFAYQITNIDVDFDGHDVYYFKDQRYVFFCVILDDYISAMKQRSPKWMTVTLSADSFRKYAMPIEELLSG